MTVTSSISLVALSLLALSAPSASPAEPSPPTSQKSNILILVADDVGVDQLASYGLGSDLPNTPVLDALALNGIQFRNAWSNPVCSSTRATILTGRYAFRTGMGHVSDFKFTLSPDELFLPEALDQESTGYQHAAIGKWHLPLDYQNEKYDPNAAGFQHYAGSLNNVVPPKTSYFSWNQTEDGNTTPATGYLTSRTTRDAATWINGTTGPWVCYVAYHAAHIPFHAPLPGLFTVDLSTAGPPGTDPRPYYKAMVEAMDFEIGRLFELIAEQLPDTTVIFVGDNGTPTQVTVPPFLPGHAKATIFQGGIQVPLIIGGRDVAMPGTECNALVSTVDIFATVAELTGAEGAFNASAFPVSTLPDTTIPIPSASSAALSDPTSWIPVITEPKRPELTKVPPPLVQIDGVSLVPYLIEPMQPSIRETVFAEVFLPNGFGPTTTCRRTIRNGRYKYMYNDPAAQTPEDGGDPIVATPTSAEALYDLLVDPFELSNLLTKPTLTESESLALRDLKLALSAVLEN